VGRKTFDSFPEGEGISVFAMAAEQLCNTLRCVLPKLLTNNLHVQLSIAIFYLLFFRMVSGFKDPFITCIELLDVSLTKPMQNYFSHIFTSLQPHI
jgi:hypothetical protein